MRITSSLLAILLVSASACVDLADDPGTDPTGKTGGVCSNCDDNGLPPGAWMKAPVDLSPGTLASYGLHDGTVVRPLCDPGLPITRDPAGFVHCTIDVDWWTWASADFDRMSLLFYIIKVSGQASPIPGVTASDIVDLRDPAMTRVRGSFGLAPSALESPWDAPVSSTITGALAVLVDMNANGVAVCLRTATSPPCPPSYSYQELAATGDLFNGVREVVVGGYDAEYPDDSTRVCPGGGVPCNVYQRREHYTAATCSYVGPTTQRYPVSCYDPDDPASIRTYPVQVFLPFSPLAFSSTPATGPHL